MNPVTPAVAPHPIGLSASAAAASCPGVPGEASGLGDCPRARLGEGLSTVENGAGLDPDPSVSRPVLEYRNGTDEAKAKRKRWDDPRLIAATLGYLAIVPVSAAGLWLGVSVNAENPVVIVATILGVNLAVAALAYILSSHPLWRAACSGFLNTIVVTLSLAAVGLLMSAP